MDADGSGRGDDTPSGLGLGLHFDLEDHDGQATLVASFTPRPHHQGATGFLHGGVAAAALDEAMAGLGYALDRTRTVTATLELRYRRPVPMDAAPLRVEAWRSRVEARRQQRVQGHILLPDGTLAVGATGIFVQAVLGS